MPCLATIIFAIPWWCGLISATLLSPTSTSTPPIVDLDYTVHAAIQSNNDATYYNFSNVRFGASTAGPNRFRAPKEPAINRTLTNGNDLNIQCPQATPKWNSEGLQQVELLEKALLVQNRTLYDAVLAGVITINNFNASNAQADNGSSLTPEPTAGETEDCLFLDVVVPRSTWENRHNGSIKKAPVLIWLYGGGYVEGSKRNASPGTTGGFPQGMVERSIQTGNSSNETGIAPTIIVLPNYRLGLFGWLGGETVASNGMLNAGLLDQKLAFDWVQQYIHLFGGDPEMVTVAGESAGGGSIMLHVTAEGGDGGKLPFTAAVMQSPTFYPLSQHDPRPESTTRAVMKMANVATLEELRAVPFEHLWDINTAVIANANYGFFNFGPLIDGCYVPDWPSRLLLEGRFNKEVELLIGNNANEGFLFTSPSLPNTTSAFSALVQPQFPTANKTARAQIEQILYPPSFSTQEGYVNEFGRQEALYVDSQFTCTSIGFLQALPEQSFRYIFEGPPGYHGQDIPYTWADYPPEQSILLNATVATVLQEWILSFTASRRPRSNATDITFQSYGSDRNIVELGSEGILKANDNTSEQRCSWWQRNPYG